MKKVLLTGASGLIGSQVLQHLRQRHEVYAIDILADKKTNIKYADFCNAEDLNEIKTGGFNPDAVVHIGALNAAIDKEQRNQNKNFFNQDILEWVQYFDTNVIGTVQLVKAFLPHMLKMHAGRFIFFGSTYGKVSPPKELYYREGEQPFYKDPAYGASKAAVANLSKYLASFYGDSGVTFNTIIPGGVISNQTDEFIYNYSQIVPLRRMGKPNELNSAIDFLLDNRSGYVQGSEVVVDGGWTAV